MSTRKTAKPATDVKLVRCAIYTRKSTEEGLEQEFNSLDAQRESGEACVAAQKHEGWVCLPEAAGDAAAAGGSSGADQRADPTGRAAGDGAARATCWAAARACRC
jgi:site-specific DNA recombinase